MRCNMKDDFIDSFKETYALIFRTDLSTFLKKSIVIVIYSLCKEVTSIMQVTISKNRWAEHVSFTEEKKSSYTLLVEA